MPTQRLTVIGFVTLFKAATYFIQAKAQNFSFGNLGVLAVHPVFRVQLTRIGISRGYLLP
jgi:hypothetical protein